MSARPWYSRPWARRSPPWLWMTKACELRAPALRGARLVYVTPGHQFPLGISMSLPRRLQLLEWARKSRRAHIRRRLRQRISLFGPPGSGVARPGSQRLGALRGKLQQSAVSLASSRIPGDPAGPGGLLCGREIDHHPACAVARSGGVVRLHRRRALRTAFAAHARRLCGAVVGSAAECAGEAGRIARYFERRGWLADGGMAARRYHAANRPLAPPPRAMWK